MALTKVSRGLLSTGIVDNSTTTAITIDSSENVGIGTVPKSGWVTNAIQLGTNLALAEDANSAYLSANAYNSSTGWKRTNSQLAGYIRMGTNDGIFSFSNAVTGAADSTITWQERMRIDSSGRVLINTTTAAELLNVANTAGNGAGVEFAGNGNTIGSTSAFYGQGSNSDAYVWNRANSPVLFGTNNTQRMRIDSSGNLLVGTTTGSTKLTVQGTSTGDVVTVLSGATSNTNVGMIVFRDGGSDFCGQITTNGSTNTTSYNTSSDQRLKENIADADDAGSKIDAIQVRKFDWIKSGLHQDYGMIAQELQAVAPEAVSTPEDPEEMMGVDYSKLVPMLVKEIQSLRSRVAELENN